ncbi:ABC transporter permease [Trueperella sp. LYQ143]|uniref:ABC transporter permease n=1 Tax=Trueperella sp. LYQ143 TaxID=3391059 RepID=UPI0039835F78
MNNVLWSNLRRKPGRLVATVIAVAMSVAFIIVTLSLSNSINNSLVQATAYQVQHTSVIMTCADSPSTTDNDPHCLQLPATLREHPEVSQADITTSLGAELRSAHALTFAEIGSVISPEQRWQELTSGQMPTTSGEIALGSSTAETLEVSIGDTVYLEGADHSANTYRITGIYDDDVPGMLPSATMLDKDIRAAIPGSFFYSNILVSSNSLNAEQLASFLQQLPEMRSFNITPDKIQTAAQYTEDSINKMTGNDDTLKTVLLGFVLIALIVASIVVSLTFHVLIAQRTRDLALVRCLGATRAQIRRMVINEAALIGTISAIFGSILGVAVTFILFPMFNLAPDLHGLMGSIVAAFIVGLVLTVVCALNPARRATRVSPMAALRPVDMVRESSRIRYGRLALAWLFFFASAAVLAQSIRNNMLIPAVFSGALLFIATVIVSRYIIPALIRATAAIGGNRGTTARLAVSNLLRNTSRTVATAAALIVGIGLVTCVIVGKTSMEESLIQELDTRRPFDFVVTGEDLTPEQLAPVAHFDGVERMHITPAATVSAVDLSENAAGAIAPPQIADSTSTESEHAAATDTSSALTAILLADDTSVTKLARSSLPVPEVGTVFTSNAGIFGVADGQQITVSQGATQVQLTVHELRGFGENILWANPQDVARFHTHSAAILRVSDSVTLSDLSQLSAQLRSLGTDITLSASAIDRVHYETILDQLMFIVLGLLGAAVIISIVGVSNTLALSVIERRRESGLLRALGYSRPQMRRMISVEALLTVFSAVIIGVTLGVVEGWAGTFTLTQGAELPAHFVFPWQWILGIIGVAGVTAYLAALLPARSAARVSPLEAIAAE